MGREAIEGECNGNNFDAKFTKRAEFRRGRTSNGKSLKCGGRGGYAEEDGQR